MVIDATVYFSDVFIRRSQLTGASQRRNLREIKQRGFFSASVLPSHALRRHRSGSRDLREEHKKCSFISPKICDLTSKSHASLTLSLISSFSTSVHLLPSFPSPSSPSSPSPRVRPQRKFIGGGGMPVEVKRVSGSPSASPIILYGWSSGGAFITLNYTLRLLPLPPGPCRTALALSSYHLTQEERNAGNSWYIAQHLPSTWLHCGSLNFTSSHPHYVMYVVYGWDHRRICGEPKWAAEAYCLMRPRACL